MFRSDQKMLPVLCFWQAFLLAEHHPLISIHRHPSIPSVGDLMHDYDGELGLLPPSVEEGIGIATAAFCELLEAFS